MRAMQIQNFGSSAEFYEAEVPKPKIKPGQVLIKVFATSVNPLDYKLRNGSYATLVPNFPVILHGDVAGVVEETATNVTTFKQGDEVYGCIGGYLALQGALAQYVVADHRLISLKPKTLSLYQSAALPLVAQTAWEGLFNKAHLKPKQTVLIYGGTGGVGHIAALFAKAAGANVTVTASSAAKAKIITNQLEIQSILNYKNQSIEDFVDTTLKGQGFDIVFDTVGGDNLYAAFKGVANDGQVITILPVGDYDLTGLYFKNASLHTVFQPLPIMSQQNMEKYGNMLKLIANFIDNNNIKPLIDTTNFTFNQVAKAHDYLESGKAIGKLVITI
jgi:NADPH2:quinone reductase